MDFKSQFMLSRYACGWVILLSFIAQSCASVPQYDATADTQLSNLQKEVDSQIVQFISLADQGDDASNKAGSYSQNIPFYNKIDTDLTSVELRMEAVSDPSTKNLPQIFANLRTQFNNIQKVHKDKGNLPAIVWRPLRDQMNAQFAVLLTYELSLKGVGSPASSSTNSTSTTTAAKQAAAATPN